MLHLITKYDLFVPWTYITESVHYLHARYVCVSLTSLFIPSVLDYSSFTLICNELSVTMTLVFWFFGGFFCNELCLHVFAWCSESFEM